MNVDQRLHGGLQILQHSKTALDGLEQFLTYHGTEGTAKRGRQVVNQHVQGGDRLLKQSFAVLEAH